MSAGALINRWHISMTALNVTCTQQKMNVTENLKFVLRRVENILEKIENAGHQKASSTVLINSVGMHDCLKMSVWLSFDCCKINARNDLE